MSKKPRILVTNDDGVHAPGLKVLERIAKALSDDVWVVAPETEQSGVAHSLTLHQPVRIRKISARRFAVSGTPTDCVLLAKQVVFAGQQMPDLLLSGVNRGSNVGDDVTYSGTIAAAMEGTLLGVPSMALSQETVDYANVHWKCAETHAPPLIRKLLKTGWPRGTLININFPDCAADKAKGVQVAPQGKRKIGVAHTERLDPKGRPYYWIGGGRSNEPEVAGTDLAMLDRFHITVTPLKLDLTDQDSLRGIRKALGNKA